MSNQYPNVNWNVELESDDGIIGTWEKVAIAVLMDIRRELQTLNGLMRLAKERGSDEDGGGDPASRS